jgi:hypothetical protein
MWTKFKLSAQFWVDVSKNANILHLDLHPKLCGEFNFYPYLCNITHNIQEDQTEHKNDLYDG